MPCEPSGDKLVIQSGRQDLLSRNTDLETVDPPRERVDREERSEGEGLARPGRRPSRNGPAGGLGRGRERPQVAASKARVGQIRSASFLGGFVSTFCLKLGNSGKYVQKSKLLVPWRRAWRARPFQESQGGEPSGSGRFNINLRSIYRSPDVTSKLPEAREREDPISGRGAPRRTGTLIFHGRTMDALIFHGRGMERASIRAPQRCLPGLPLGRCRVGGGGEGGARGRTAEVERS